MPVRADSALRSTPISAASYPLSCVAVCVPTSAAIRITAARVATSARTVSVRGASARRSVSAASHPWSSAAVSVSTSAATRTTAEAVAPSARTVPVRAGSGQGVPAHCLCADRNQLRWGLRQPHDPPVATAAPAATPAEPIKSAKGGRTAPPLAAPAAATCGGVCVDLSNDPRATAARVASSARAPARAESAPRSTSTLVALDPPLMRGSRCVDVSTDPNHCGARGSVCPAGYAPVGYVPDRPRSEVYFNYPLPPAPYRYAGRQSHHDPSRRILHSPHAVTPRWSRTRFRSRH